MIWFLLDGDTIVINSLEGRRWPSNLRRDPRISVAVTDATTENWVGISGTVEVVDDQARGPGRHRGDGPPLPRRRSGATPRSSSSAASEPQQRVSFRITPIAIHDHLDED